MDPQSANSGATPSLQATGRSPASLLMGAAAPLTAMQPMVAHQAGQYDLIDDGTTMQVSMLGMMPPNTTHGAASLGAAGGGGGIAGARGGGGGSANGSQSGGRTFPLEETVGGDLQRSFIRGYFAEAPMMHAIPTLYVIGASTVAVSLLTYFLQTTVVNATGHLSVFFFGAFTCFSSYYMAAHFLGEHARSFQRITPDKKLYTVSNLIKAGVLAALTPLSLQALSDGMMYDNWNTNTLRNLGCIYAIPDFVSLLVVRRMSTSTVIHHIVVLIFCVFSLWNDFSEHNVFRGIAVYGVFSTFGYVVYMLLATRFLGVSAGLARAISTIALVVYVGSCGVNWMWQVTYLKTLYDYYHHWSIYPYLAMLALVIYDDINLCRWLLHNTKIQRRPRQQRPSSVAQQGAMPASTGAASSVLADPVGPQPRLVISTLASQPQ